MAQSTWWTSTYINSMCFPLITLRDDAGIHEGGECEVGEHKECDDALTCWHPGVVVDVVLGTKTRMMWARARWHQRWTRWHSREVEERRCGDEQQDPRERRRDVARLHVALGHAGGGGDTRARAGAGLAGGGAKPCAYSHAGQHGCRGERDQERRLFGGELSQRRAARERATASLTTGQCQRWFRMIHSIHPPNQNKCLYDPTSVMNR